MDEKKKKKNGTEAKHSIEKTHDRENADDSSRGRGRDGSATVVGDRKAIKNARTRGQLSRASALEMHADERTVRIIELATGVRVPRTT